MTEAPGWNPLRWNCDTNGCFNKLRRPKIEVFAECFPGKSNFGDVDGLVEVNGHFCLLEWKGTGGQVHTGQRISFERFVACPGNVVFVVNGNAETMTVSSYDVFWKNQRQHHPGSLDDVKKRMKSWAAHAQTLPRRSA
jgi:hypothetical protein